jgi:biopolymer transport protein ExbB
MDSVIALWNQADAVGRAVAALLMAMSVTSWTVILWKLGTLPTAWRRLQRGTATFWAASDGSQARVALRRSGAHGLLGPMVDGAMAGTAGRGLDAGNSTRASTRNRLTRQLRTALQSQVEALQSGQVVLASIGSTAPFVGLFGTVWSIQRALAALGAGSGGDQGSPMASMASAAAAFTLEQIATPVGEALVMTAAGLAVAVPAVLAYNLFGRWVARCEAALEGFAHDLLAWAEEDAERKREPARASGPGDSGQPDGPAAS